MPRFVLLALAGGLALAACGPSQPPKMPPPAVGVVTIAEQPVPLSVELPGRTTPYAVSEIRPQISGIVQKRLFVEGSTVKRGQPLYQIDPAPLSRRTTMRWPTLATTKAKAERYQRLVAENAIAPRTPTTRAPPICRPRPMPTPPASTWTTPASSRPSPGASALPP